MSEAAEISQNMSEGYAEWLRRSHEDNSADSARKFVLGDSILAQESPQVIDNVAWALYCNAAWALHWSAK